MPTLQDIISTVRHRVQTNNGYLGNSEIRTKYVLIDPLLRALGWNTGDPAQVQLELSTGNSTKKADYVLFRRGIKKPVGVVEAKLLAADEISKFRERMHHVDVAIVNRFESLQKGVVNERDTLFDGETWSGLKQAHEIQLKEYVHDLELRAGYGILTNGDDWWIYDLKKYDLGNGVSAFDDAVIAGTSVLQDNPDKAVGVLNLIRRSVSWPGL